MLGIRRMLRHMDFVLIAFLFFLGIANFTIHRAIMESGHPILQQIPWFARRNGRYISWGIEFCVLLAAMLLVDFGWEAMVWGYLFYTASNVISAWLMLSGRV